MPNTYTTKYTAREEMPDLSSHNNHMSKCMTEEIYKRMRATQTSTGFTIDNVIQTGVDNPGELLFELNMKHSIFELFVMKEKMTK